MSNQIPAVDWVPPLTESPQSNDDAFYTSVLPNTEVDDPIELYNYIKEEQREQGKSLLVEQAKMQWVAEQEQGVNLLVENLASDALLSKEEKVKTLNDYLLTTTISTDIKDKAIKELSDSFLFDNNLDTDNASVELVTEQVEELKLSQQAEDFMESVRAGKSSRVATEEESAEVGISILNQEKVYGSDATEPITSSMFWFADMIIGKTIPWVANTLDIISQKLGVGESLAKLVGSETLAKELAKQYPQDKRWTDIQNEVYSADTTLNRWEISVTDALTELGYSPEALQNSIPGLVFNKGVGYVIEKIAEYTTPDDPAKTAIPLEIGINLLPFILLKNRGSKDLETTSSAVDEGGMRDVHVRATKEQMEAVREANRKAAEEHKKKNINPSKENKVKVNSPVVTLHKSNPRTAGTLTKAMIEDKTGQVAEAAGITSNQLAMYLTDPNSNIIRNTQMGWRTDVSTAAAMEATNNRTRTLLIDNPNLADSQAVADLAERTALTINGIVPEVPMIVSNSQIITSYVRTPNGMLQSVVFVKSPTEFYTKKDIMTAYLQAEKSILANFAGEGTSIKPRELLIQEVTADNNVLREFTKDTFLQVTPESLLNTNSYYIRWTPDVPMYEYNNNVMGAVPSERFPTTKVTDKIQRFIFDTEASASKTGGMQRFFVYGRHNPKLEKKVYLDEIVKQGFFEQQKRILIQSLVKDLSVTEQNQLGILLEYSDKFGRNQLTHKDIIMALDTAPTVESMNKLQVSLNTFRLYDNALLAADNVTYVNQLLETGYEKSFIIPKSSKEVRMVETPPEVMPVKAEFDIAELDAYDTIFDRSGQELNAIAWDYLNNKPVSFNAGERGVRTHYTVGEDGMPIAQVYRLKRNYIDGNGDIYQYGVFGTLRPQPLPNQVIPARPGHLPRQHKASTVVIRIPLEQTINGRTIKKEYADQFYELGNSRILDLEGSLLTKKQKAERAEVFGILREFGVTIAMVNSPAEAYSYSRKHLSTEDKGAMYIIDRAAELKLNEVADFRIREQASIQSTRLRNDQLDYKVTSDPLSTALENARVAEVAYSNIGLLQLKKEWVKTYMPMRGKKFDFDLPQTTDGVLTTDIPVPEFPLEISSMRSKNMDFDEITRQAKADWWLITNKERSSMAVDTKYSAHAIRKLMDNIAKATENRKLGKGIAKTAREIQKNPEALQGSPLAAVTTFQLLVNAPKQLFLQGAAPIANLLTVSEGVPFGPDFWSNVTTMIALTHRYAKMTSDYKKNGKDITRLNDMFFQEQVVKAFEGTEFVENGPLMKYTPKQLEILVQGIKDYSISLVGEHIYTQGLIINRPPHLGEGATPGKITKAGIKVLTDVGFGAGELFQRFGQVVVALETWKKNNPGKRWESKENVAQIMWDAYRLSGSMTKATNLAWQNSLTLRTLAQFKSFMAKITETALNPNSTPFNFNQRMEALAWTGALYGFGATALGAAVGSIISSILDQFDDKYAWEAARFMEKFNLFYQVGNLVGDTMFPDDRASMSKFGDLFNLYGKDFDFLGPYATVIELMIGVMNEDIDYNNAGATIGFIKRTLDVGDEILEIWVHNPAAYNDDAVMRSMMSLGTLFPPTKAYLQYNKEMENEFRATTKTGHEYGWKQTQSEAFFKAFWGVRTTNEENLWDVATNESGRKKSIQLHARQFVKIVSSSSHGGVPTYMDIAKGIQDYTVLLNGEGFIANSKEHFQFVTEVFSIMGRQKTPMSQNFIKNYYSRIYSGQTLTSEEVVQARKIIKMNYEEGTEEYATAMNFLNSMDAVRNAKTINNKE